MLELLVQPRASMDEFTGVHGDRLRVRITAPPVDGKANKHLIEFCARTCDLPKSAVSVISGESDRRKRVRILKPRHLPATVSRDPEP